MSTHGYGPDDAYDNAYDAYDSEHAGELAGGEGGASAAGRRPNPLRSPVRRRLAGGVIVLLPLAAWPWAGRSVPRWVLVGLVAALLVSVVLAGPVATARGLWRAVGVLDLRGVLGVDHGDRSTDFYGEATGELGAGTGGIITNDAALPGAWDDAVDAEPTGPVKQDHGDDLVERVQDRWGEAAKWAGLTHPTEKDVIPPAVGPARRNGVGGVVLLVDPDPARRLLGDFRSHATKIRASFQVEHVFVARGEEGLVELHVYDGQPLAAPIDVSWLADHPVVGDRVPIGPTATARAAALPLRQSAMFTALTESGKTNAQLAFEVSLAYSAVPAAAVVLDNKGERGGSELRPIQAGALLYRNRTEQVWECLSVVLDVMADRLEIVGGRDTLPVSPRHPVLTFLVAEGLDVVRVRVPDLPFEVPPKGSKAAAEARAWAHYTGGRLDARPSVADWQAFIRDHIGLVNRQGRLVNVRISWAQQLAQVSEVPTGLRGSFPNRWAGRLGAPSDVKPALGVEDRLAPAHLIPRDQRGAGYLAIGDANPQFHRPVLTDDRAVEELLVPHYQRFLPDRPPRLHVVGDYPS